MLKLYRNLYRTSDHLPEASGQFRVLVAARNELIDFAAWVT